MTEPRYCIDCNSQLPDEAPEGLCPKCLLKLALDPSESLATIPLSDAPLLTGIRVHYFGDYELLEEIARGGMGVVYKARQMSLNRVVAVKMMRPGLLASEADIQRFRVEAEAAASLQHPGIIAIHEVGEQDGMCYFSMDYVEGRNLAEIVRNHPLSVKRAAAYIKTISEAVEFAHQRGVLHRDLKPANVIVDSSDQPRITDFGLARKIEEDSRLTETGAVLGTPSYMPPEQAAGKRNQPGPASDVYSLGAMLYEMLTARPPFQAETPVDTLMLVLHAEPVAPRLLNPKIDRNIETICLKCLEKDSRKRYQTARELADDLDRFLNGKPIKARPVGRINRVGRWCRRNPWAAIAASMLALLAIVATFSAITLRERLWRSIIEQARSERLAGNRSRSMELLAEAARMKKSDDLRREAIQTITASGLRLRLKIPFIRSEKVAVSADSKLLAIAGRKQGSYERHTQFSHETIGTITPKIEVWDIESGKMLSEIDHNVERIDEELVFSPGAPLLAVPRVHYKTETSHDSKGGTETRYLGISDQAIILWNAINGEKIAEIECKGEMCSEADGPFVFSPDGRYLVRGGEERDAWLIDVPARSSSAICLEGDPAAFLSNDELLLECDGRLIRRNIWTKQYGFVSPEGTRLISLSEDGRTALLQSKSSLVLLDIQTGRQTAVATLDEDRSEVILSGDGRLVAMLDKSEPNVVHLYEMTAAGLKHRTIALGSNIKIFLSHKQAAFSPDGSLLAAFGGEGKQGSLWVWDTHSSAEVALLRENFLPIWSNDGRLLITRGPGEVQLSPNSTSSSSSAFNGIIAGSSYVNVWEIFPRTPIYLLPDNIASIAFSPDQKQLLSNGVIWDVVSVRNRIELRPTSQQLPAHSTVLASGDQLWIANTPEKDFLLRLRQLAPGHREIALASPDYSGLKIKGNLFARPSAFAISPDGRSLVVASAIWQREMGGGSSSGLETVLERWDTDEGKRLAILNENNIDQTFYSLRLSPDGKLLATAHGDDIRGIVIRDAATGKEISTIKNGCLAYAMVFSPDGKHIFSSGISIRKEDESPILVYEVETGRFVRELKGHYDDVRVLAISPDGQMLASGGGDRRICLWDTASGRKLASWEAHNTTVAALAFSRDGRTLASGSTDGVLRLWDLPFIRRELSTIGLDW